jgi:hypothetical protein
VVSGVSSWHHEFVEFGGEGRVGVGRSAHGHGSGEPGIEFVSRGRARLAGFERGE